MDNTFSETDNIINKTYDKNNIKRYVIINITFILIITTEILFFTYIICNNINTVSNSLKNIHNEEMEFNKKMLQHMQLLNIYEQHFDDMLRELLKLSINIFNKIKKNDF